MFALRSIIVCAKKTERERERESDAGDKSACIFVTHHHTINKMYTETI